jgi:hypothetical protein
MSKPNVIIITGHSTPQKLTMIPLASKNKPKPTIMIIVPKTMAAIMPPFGKPKHSFSMRL